jgi:sporulation protein YlmC with PRC-barrel domain
MNQEQAGQEIPLPQRIYEGMTVYDSKGEVVGTVQVVYFGGASREAVERVLKSDQSPDVATSENDESNFDANEVPKELRARMMRQGYILVTGPDLTGVKRFVTPEKIEGVFSEEIEGVMKDAVRLRVTRSELFNV